MTIFILWDEDGHLVKLCSTKEIAISYIKKHNETDEVKENRYRDTKTDNGDWLYDLELETSETRYRLEERKIDDN